MYALETLKITCSRLYFNFKPTLIKNNFIKCYARKADELLRKECEKNLKEIQVAASRILLQIAQEITKEFEAAKSGYVKKAQQIAQEGLSKAIQDLQKEFEHVKKEACKRTEGEVNEAIDVLRKQTQGTLEKLKKVIDNIQMFKQKQH